MQCLALKWKKAGILNVFSLYLPTQSGDPHFLFEPLNGNHVSYLLVGFYQNHMRSLGDIEKIRTFSRLEKMAGKLILHVFSSV